MAVVVTKNNGLVPIGPYTGPYESQLVAAGYASYDNSGVFYDAELTPAAIDAAGGDPTARRIAGVDLLSFYQATDPDLTNALKKSALSGQLVRVSKGNSDYIISDKVSFTLTGSGLIGVGPKPVFRAKDALLGTMMEITNTSNIRISGIAFNGNASARSTTANFVVVFQCDDVLFSDCDFQDSLGIGLIFSTAITNSGARGCSFKNIGRKWESTGLIADAKQALSFTAAGGAQSANYGNFSEANRFTAIGLDALSLTGQTGFRAAGTRAPAKGGWTGAQQSAVIYAANCANTSIYDNIGSGASGNGIDLLDMVGLTADGNEMVFCGTGGFSLAASGAETTRDCVISNNVLKNNYQTGTGGVSGGIAIGGSTTSVGPTMSRIVVTGNVATDDQTTKTQQFGAVRFNSLTITDLWLDQNNRFGGNASAELSGLSYSSAPFSGAIVPVAQVADNTNTGGNSRGTNATDWQTLRQSPAQVASGAGSGIHSGTNNEASGQFSSTSGTQNVTRGIGSHTRGMFANDRNRRALDAWAGGQFSRQGDGQSAQALMLAKTTSTTPRRLTTDNASSIINQNSFNLPNLNLPAALNAVYLLTIDVVAVNITTSGNWVVQSYRGALTRMGATSTAAYTAIGAPVTVSNGTIGTIAVAADSANDGGGLALTWTAPNADEWHVVARVQAVEVFG